MCNVGGIDKVLRITIGSILLVFALDGEKIIGQQMLWAWVGLVPLLSGIFNFCPTYLLIGFTTSITDKYT